MHVLNERAKRGLTGAHAQGVLVLRDLGRSPLRVADMMLGSGLLAQGGAWPGDFLGILPADPLTLHAIWTASFPPSGVRGPPG